MITIFTKSKPRARDEAARPSGDNAAGKAVQRRSQAQDVEAELSDVISILDAEIIDDHEASEEDPWLGRGALLTMADGLRGGHVFNLVQASQKAWLYSNSRLSKPTPFTAFIPTYALCCAAAKYALDVYLKRPKTAGSRASILIPRSTRFGTKAMMLTISRCQHANTPTLLIALRGSASFADWAVNFRQRPSSPQGFLDDPGNLVHAGFLAVAKSTVKSVANELEAYLKRHKIDGGAGGTIQLLLTGHSAGGAVASLLYCHIVSQSDEVSSPLKTMARQFKRVHCITFGAPPISLLPIQRPVTRRDNKQKWHQNLFLALINEGDPVVRADRAYIRSMVDLYLATKPASRDTVWPVPVTTFSLSGRLLVMRPATAVGTSSQGPIPAVTRTELVQTNDTQMRSVVYGDISTHSMRLYKDRINQIAVAKITCT